MSDSTQRSSHAAQEMADVTGAKTVLDFTGGEENIDGNYDLITCFNLLDQLSAARASEVVDRLCAVAGQVAISTWDGDQGTVTHPDTASVPVLAARFAEHGFVRRTDVEGVLTTSGAVLFERADLDLRDVVLRYEHRLAAIAPTGDEQEGDDTGTRHLQHQLLTMRDHVIGTEAEVGRLSRDLAVAQYEARGAKKRLKMVTERRDDLRAKLEAVRAKLSNKNEELDRLRTRLAARDTKSSEQPVDEPSLTHRAARRLLGRAQ